MKFLLFVLFVNLLRSQSSVSMMTPTYVDPDTNQQYDPNNYGQNDEYGQYRSLLVNQYTQGQNMYGDNRKDMSIPGMSSSKSAAGDDKDPNVPQTYPFLGISYKISNPPYAPVTLVPYVEEDNTTKDVGTTVQSNVVITSRKKKIV